MQKVIIISLILLIITGVALGQVPHLINYQGVLIDPATGQPVPDVTHSIEFSIYDVPTGGSAGWTEIHNVVTENGFYSVQLGLNTPLTIDDLSGPEKYLGIKVDEDPEMTPRKRIVSVAYAIMCEESLNSWNLTGNSGTTAGTNFLGTTDNQPLIFKTNEVEALRINTDGNIGLGTTTPSYKLHVTGSVSGPLVHFGNFLHTGTSLQLSVADQNTPTALTMYTTNAAGSESGVSIDFKGTKVGGSGYNAARISGFLTDPSTAIDGAVTIQTLGGGTLSERVRFQGDGNVGIGITNPSSKLQVAGMIHSSAGGFKFPDGTTQTTAATSGSGGGWTDGGENVYLTTSTDKVGIGDTSPTHKLDVAGKIGINDTQVLFLPDQTTFEGTLYLGDGGGSLSHSSGNQGRYNTAIGLGALNANTTGYSNTAIGYNALYSNTTGFCNTASGNKALYSNTEGGYNTANGFMALYTNTEGNWNTANGYGALYFNSTGSRNTTSGHQALFNNITGSYNVGIGYESNYYNQAGANNTIIGYQAGRGTSAHDKSGNIFIGYQAGYNETESNKLYIENSNSGSPLIGGDFSTDELYLNGNVGIGTASPGAELDVAGKTITSQLQVGTSTTAGYVLTADAIGNATWQAATGGGGGWTDGGTNVYLTTSTDKVGIGDSSPTHKLDVAGKIGIDDTQVLYLPDQTDFLGTLFLGDGGSSLNHSSGDDGRLNTAVGIGALNANTTGHHNTASGFTALVSNTEGFSNTANGVSALSSNITGDYNTASGADAIGSNTTGSFNVGIGSGSNYYNQEGSNNTIIGFQAGRGTSEHNKSGNVFIGFQAGYNETGSNKLYIENSNSDSPLIGGDFSTDELYLNGKVGIGTNNPLSQLSVGGDGLAGVAIAGETHVGDGYGGRFWAYGTGISIGVYGRANDYSAVENYGGYFRANGEKGFGVYAIAMGSYSTGIYAKGGSEGNAAEFEGNVLIHDGKVTTPVLEITGGSDLSEQFEIREGESELLPSPGMVVSIAPERPGDLLISDMAYDRRVAGIISGAGDIEPGMIMGQSNSLADGKYPVALTGRVYCWADASNGAIQPGDLLTTSDTPGHTMKVTDYERAQGAVIGKAMSSLEEGRGLVLVLVTLQ